MKSSDLKIGNIIGLQFINRRPQQDNTVKTDMFLEPCTVNEIKESSVNISDLGRNMRVIVQYEYVKPIPITAEWLERLGFSFNRSVAVFDEFQKENIVYMIWKNGRKDLGLDTNVVSYGNKHIKCQFVHQLQNLYYALCGEELTLKTESK